MQESRVFGMNTYDKMLDITHIISSIYSIYIGSLSDLHQ